jgi:predicted nucleic acid-binding protein
LIYAHDLDAGIKHQVAVSLMEDLWERENGALSVQVLQEFYVNVTRKITKPISPAQARGVIRNYLAWQIQRNDPDTIFFASELEERYQLSFWDSLIVAAASTARVDKILTEDLQHGQVIAGILVENPFLSIS